MEKRIILSGTAKAVGNIVKENRIREKRGEIAFEEVDEREMKLEKREQALAEREKQVAEQEKLLSECGKVEDKNAKSKK